MCSIWGTADDDIVPYCSRIGYIYLVSAWFTENHGTGGPIWTGLYLFLCYGIQTQIGQSFSSDKIDC